jgi:hypothetical protein
LNPELAHYIVRFHHDLLADTERRARWHLFATMKATEGRSDLAAQSEAKNYKPLSRHLSSDPDVLRLASHGYEAFLLRTAQRILQDSADKLLLNYCPQCGKLARTPTARQCRFCGYEWHHER